MKWTSLFLIFAIFITQNAADERLRPLNITKLVVEGIKEAAEDIVALVSHRISNTLVDLIKEVEEVLPEQANSTFRLLKGVKETTTELQTSILHDFRIVLYRLQENLTQASGMKMPHPMMAPADWEQGVRSHDEPLSTELKADLEKVTDVLTKFQNYAQLLIAPFIKTLGLDTMKANVTVPIDLFNSSNATLALNQTTKLLKVAGKLLETSRKVEDLKKVTGSVEKEPYSSTPSVV